MSVRTKQLVVILAAQAGCVAVGLWMHYRFVESAIEKAQLKTTWRELEDVGTTLQTRMQYARAAGHPQTPAYTELQAAAQALASTPAPRDFPALLLDHQWRVVLHRAAALDPQPHAPKTGQTVAFEPVTDPDVAGASAEQFMQGTVTIDDEPHLAMARSLPDASGYVLVLCPAGYAAKQSGQMLASVPAATLMALVWTCALLTLVTYMVVTRFQDAAARSRAENDAKSLRRIESLVRTRNAVIFGLAKLADSRDPETGSHLDRIAVYSSTLASTLRDHPRYAGVVDASFVRTIAISSALHDIGKVGIADSILRKPGPLSSDERSLMQVHTVVGADCIRQIEQQLGSSNFLEMAREIASAHHERWDGTGYPAGLSGEDIPLSARIVAIADVYDALSSRRVYKPPMAHEKCVQIIQSDAGRHFDPALVEIWLTVAPQFAEIAQRYGDPEDGPAAVIEKTGAAQQTAAPAVAS